MVTRRIFAESAVLGLAGFVGTGCLSVHEAELSLYAFKYAQSTISEDRV